MSYLIYVLGVSVVCMHPSLHVGINWMEVKSIGAARGAEGAVFILRETCPGH